MSKKTKVVITIQDKDDGTASAVFKFIPEILAGAELTPSQSAAMELLEFLSKGGAKWTP